MSDGYSNSPLAAGTFLTSSADCSTIETTGGLLYLRVLIPTGWTTRGFCWSRRLPFWIYLVLDGNRQRGNLLFVITLFQFVLSFLTSQLLESCPGNLTLLGASFKSNSVRVGFFIIFETASSVSAENFSWWASSWVSAYEEEEILLKIHLRSVRQMGLEPRWRSKENLNFISFQHPLLSYLQFVNQSHLVDICFLPVPANQCCIAFERDGRGWRKRSSYNAGACSSASFFFGYTGNNLLNNFNAWFCGKFIYFYLKWIWASEQICKQFHFSSLGLIQQQVFVFSIVKKRHR